MNTKNIKSLDDDFKIKVFENILGDSPNTEVLDAYVKKFRLLDDKFQKATTFRNLFRVLETKYDKEEYRTNTKGIYTDIAMVFIALIKANSVQNSLAKNEELLEFVYGMFKDNPTLSNLIIEELNDGETNFTLYMFLDRLTKNMKQSIKLDKILGNAMNKSNQFGGVFAYKKAPQELQKSIAEESKRQFFESRPSLVFLKN